MLVAAALSLSVATGASSALAQDEGYAWGGEGGGVTQTGPSTEDPLRIMGFVGAGAGVRLLRNRDEPFVHTFMTPAYVELGGAIYLPGTDLRHGAGLAVATNLSQGAGSSGIGIGAQWVITPAYQLLIPFNRLLGDMGEDAIQLQIRIGIPLVIGANLDDPGFVDFTLGGELGVALHWKFLAGFGIYIEVQGVIVGGVLDTMHPFLAADAGFLIDYEVLP